MPDNKLIIPVMSKGQLLALRPIIIIIDNVMEVWLH